MLNIILYYGVFSMAYTTGTCADGYELQTKIKDYLTTNSWTNLKDTGAGPSREMLFQNPDASVCIGFQSVLNAGIETRQNYFNLLLNVFDSYNASLTFYNQSGSVINTSTSSPAPLLTVSFEPMKYWFILNERRLIIVTYAEQTYCVAYLGKFIPHGSPEQYTKPFFLGGTGYLATTSMKNTSAYFRNFFEPDHNSNRSNFMLQVKDHKNTWNVGKWIKSFFNTVIYPTPYVFYWYDVENKIIKAHPAQLISGEYTLGILDGFYATERFGLSAESTVVIKNELGVDETYIAFPNTNASNSTYKTYYLIKLL